MVMGQLGKPPMFQKLNWWRSQKTFLFMMDLHTIKADQLLKDILKTDLIIIPALKVM